MDSTQQVAVRNAVARGVQLLDEHGPADWRERIDPDTVEVFSFTSCPLAQVFGSWSEGKDALGIEMDSGTHGFDLVPGLNELGSFVGADEHWGALDEAWRAALRGELADDDA